MEPEIEFIINKIKVPKNYKGYEMFVDALNIFFLDNDALITKEVYYPLSKKYHISEKQVEGRIRTIITYMWKNRDLSYFNFYIKGKCPSNKAFLLQLVKSV